MMKSGHGNFGHALADEDGRKTDGPSRRCLNCRLVNVVEEKVRVVRRFRQPVTIPGEAARRLPPLTCCDVHLQEVKALVMLAISATFVQL